jgi:hypothetical protein
MQWCVIRHPELGLAVVAEPSLVVHRPRGWMRVSEMVDDRDSLRVEQYADAPDLDAETDGAEQPAAAPTEPDADQGKPAAKSAKASAGKRDN